MKYKLQLWDEGELRDAPIEEWVIGLDRTADFNVKDFTDQQWLLAAIQRKCAEEDVREAERAYERSQGTHGMAGLPTTIEDQYAKRNTR